MAMTDINSVSTEIKLAVQDWVRALFQIFKSNIEKKKIKLTGDLLSSFQSYIDVNAQTLSSKIVLEFAAQGRFQDMRTVNYTKQPPVKAMEEFVREKGLAAFQYVSGFEGKNYSPTKETAIKQIAWGIAKSYKQKGTIKRKKGGWKYAKTLYSELADLKDIITIILSNSAVDIIKQEFQNL
jgi:hypothetical protein